MIIVLGDQFGDTGKGKLVDYLSSSASVCARTNGGANAGHTVSVNNTSYKFHLLPSATLHKNCQLVLASNVVIDPLKLFEELQKYKEYDVLDRLFISGEAHLVPGLYKSLDEQLDNILKIGTTKQGIGPSYEAKAGRYGLRVFDLLDKPSFIKKYEALFDITNMPHEGFISADDFYRECEFMIPMITDTTMMLLKNPSSVIEVAHGHMLDINHGTYPFVTSSSCDVGGVLSSLGVPHQDIKDVIIVTKIYSTRVGQGEFMTEIHDPELAKKIQTVGHEIGTTTGRVRRVGWMDLPMLVRGIRMNGCSNVAIFKFDLLEHFDVLKICDYYFDKTSGDILNIWTTDVHINPGKYSPHYVSFQIQNVKDLNKCKTLGMLIHNPTIDAIVTFLKKHLHTWAGAAIGYIGVGPNRDEIIDIKGRGPVYHTIENYH